MELFGWMYYIWQSLRSVALFYLWLSCTLKRNQFEYSLLHMISLACPQFILLIFKFKFIKIIIIHPLHSSFIVLFVFLIILLVSSFLLFFVFFMISVFMLLRLIHSFLVDFDVIFLQYVCIKVYLLFFPKVLLPTIYYYFLTAHQQYCIYYILLKIIKKVY